MVVMGAHEPTVASEAIEKNGNKYENNPIRIKADKLIAHVETGEVEFIGNVKATQADDVVTSDRLKIIYDPDTVKNRTPDNKNVSINKLIATGNVKIITDNIVAETERAEYTTKSKVIVLLGEQSKVSQGGHSITGTKFTLHRREGKLTVESSSENRVKAILQPSAKDN
jgi:lipopolysaccharide export system protein LptA